MSLLGRALMRLIDRDRERWRLRHLNELAASQRRMEGAGW